jgi:non-specific protein-tyrosine kinase
MELYEYWRLLVRYSPILIFTCLVGLSGASYVNFAATPKYSASADVFVTTPSTTIDIGSLATGSNFSEQRVVSYAKIISGPATLEPVIKKLNLGVTSEELAGTINASAPNGTVLIRIEVTGEDPNKVAAIANAVAEQFEQTVQFLEATSASTSTNIKVTPVRQALPNYNPVSPNTMLNLILGLILGFAVGTGLVTLKMFFDRTVKNESHLNGIPLLGTILYDPTARDAPLLTESSPYSGRAEAFRQIRTNLTFSEKLSDRKVLAITSALPNEGKTTTAINLAISVSLTGLRVLLVDADLRRPQLNLFLEIPPAQKGVTEILSQTQMLKKFKADPAGMVTEISPTLFALCSGSIPSQPAELLGSDNFVQMLDACRKAYDLVIIDCPPTLPIADATVVSTAVDATLLVVKAGKTSIKQFRGAIESILNVEGVILGCIINMIPSNRRSEEYGYNYGYRGYRTYYNYGGSAKNKSLYSPTEPYGPELKARNTVSESESTAIYPDFDGLQELIESSDGQYSNKWRNLFERPLRSVYERLSRELEIHSHGEVQTVSFGEKVRAPQSAKLSAFGFLRLGSQIVSSVNIKGKDKRILDWLRARKSKRSASPTEATASFEVEIEQMISKWSSNYDKEKSKNLMSKQTLKSSKNKSGSKVKNVKRYGKPLASKKGATR